MEIPDAGFTVGRMDIEPESPRAARTRSRTGGGAGLRVIAEDRPNTPTGARAAGVWAADNAANPRAQVITAAGEGSSVAIAINTQLVAEDVDRAVRRAAVRTAAAAATAA